MTDGRRLGDVLGDASQVQREALSNQSAAKQILIDRQRDEISARQKYLKQQQVQIQGDIAIQQERVRLAEQTLAASQILMDKGLMSALQYRQRQEAVLTAKLSYSANLRELQAIPSTLAQLSAQDQRLIAEGQEAAAMMASSNAELAQREASLQTDASTVIVASASGQIAALQAVEGGAVSSGTTLAMIVPDGVGLRAHLWLPSRAAGFLKRGDRVRLMYDAFPYQRFGVGKGRVVEIARAPVSTVELPPALKAEEDLYRVLVDLDNQVVVAYGREWNLTAGMRLQADLILEEQSLLDWLFDGMRATRARSKPL